MFRYYAIATAVVVVFGCIVAALHRGGGDVRVAAVQSTGSPSPPRAGAQSTFVPGEVTGAAPWVLSALVDCFRQERTFRGTLAHVRGEVPTAAHALGADWELRSGPCTVDFTEGRARVRRGPARAPSVDVVIPPHLAVWIEGSPAVPQTLERRRIYVLRWKREDDARLDRLATMGNARLQRCCSL